ncbi:MAG: DUF86 domain-containing protein [Eubacteriales bacterium]|nr:DUF86 domain-containing protein [Eubacteriales bacterium]
MSSKDFQILQKLYKHTMAIMKYCAEYRTLEQFESNSMCVEATVFNLMQIGELAKTSLSDVAKTSLSAIPWQQIYGLRNKIVHGYEGVSMRIVFDTVTEDIPRLNDQLKRAIEQIENA